MTRMSGKEMDDPKNSSQIENENEKNLEDTQQSEPVKAESKDDSSSDLQETQKIQVLKRISEGEPEKPKKWKSALGFLLALIVFITLGALGGMQSGIRAREDKEILAKAVEAVAQFEIGQNDLTAGQCETARQRFEYVIQLYSSFPDAAQKLAEAMLCVGVENAPLVEAQATQAATATPDGRSAEEIFAQASNFFAASIWEELIPLLDTLRVMDATYEAIEVDGMYYTALRNRGVHRILSLGELEGGIFDLNQAEQIGPLDAEASEYRQWAILYIVGQSFWDVDWAQAVQYFGEIAVVAPNLHGGNFFTAQDRLDEAETHYAKELITSAVFIAGSKGWCEANQIMEQANSYSPHSPEVQVTAEWYSEKCESITDE